MTQRITGDDVLSLDSVVSDVPGAKKTVLNHYMSLNLTSNVTTSAWSDIRFSFWNDGGVPDESGLIELQRDHAVSLRSIVIRVLGAVNSSQSVNEFVANFGCNVRVVEYKKNDMDQWAVNSILFSSYGNITNVTDFVVDVGCFDNYVFKEGCSYEIEFRARRFGAAPGNAMYCSVSLSCDFYESV